MLPSNTSRSLLFAMDGPDAFRRGSLTWRRSGGEQKAGDGFRFGSAHVPQLPSAGN
jgi:hypothetical protein